MKSIKGVLLIMLCMALLCGCGKTAKGTITNKKIRDET